MFARFFFILFFRSTTRWIACGLLISGGQNPLQACLDTLGPTVVANYYESCKIDVSVLLGIPDEASAMACTGNCDQRMYDERSVCEP